MIAITFDIAMFLPSVPADVRLQARAACGASRWKPLFGGTDPTGRAFMKSIVVNQGVRKRYENLDGTVQRSRCSCSVYPHEVTRSRPSSSKRARTVQK
jgi:hypothetical protein